MLIRRDLSTLGYGRHVGCESCKATKTLSPCSLARHGSRVGANCAVVGGSPFSDLPPISMCEMSQKVPTLCASVARVALLNKNQLAMLRFLRENSGREVSEEEAIDASNLSPASWRVYMNAGRYSPYLEKTTRDGVLKVKADQNLTEIDFYNQVKQTKGTGLEKVKANSVYKLDPKPLGEGGFALVHRGEHRKTGAVHAIKVPKGVGESSDRLRREIVIMREFDHPNIMPIVDYDDQLRWYAMPVAECSLVGMRGCGPEMVRDIVLNVAEGLKYGHQKGFVHRDVTPGNVLRLDSKWVVGDWGTVKRPKGQTTMHKTVAGQLLGTEAFAAPELWADAHSADHRADIYGLGRVVAWLLTEETRKLIPNVQLLPEGPWRPFVEKATMLEEEDRPQSVDAMLLLVPED